MKKQINHKNILIFGSDSYGLMTYYAYQNDPSKSFNIVGFIDFDLTIATLEGLKIYDFKEVTSTFIEEHSVNEIIIAVQNIETVELFNAVIQLSKLNCALKIIPPKEECTNGFIKLDQIKDLEIEDLLIRKPLYEINPSLKDTYENQVILITGAAGSIGSELSRKFAQLNYKNLILLDNAESTLYNIQQELIQKGVFNFNTFVGDIRDYNRMEQLFNLYKPKIVFHAAAYKHVPLMEEHPYEAVSANVIGTKNLANLSVKHGIDKFIFISTDKAVNPSNVMGATKRIAELYLKSLKGEGKTKFITTRFGNVLASNGSIIPLFKKQIESGGPITVTQRDIERYFMTIYEACHLILEAGAIGNGNEIFVFEMGKPINIYDLATLMFKLSDSNFSENIDIKITGLRPGEKVNEELLSPTEQAKSTYHQKIKVVQSSQLIAENVQQKIIELCEKASKIQNLELVALIKAIVPEYHSSNSKFEVLDHKKEL
jgi:FlaA1/EpsC-like NDP-sugar epimerase